MLVLSSILLLVFSYILGSIPFGLIIVRLMTGKDIRLIESGRTGGTNVMRAAGFWAGFATAMLDIFKSASAVWLARYLVGNNLVFNSFWMHVIPPILVVTGHNYSIFLIERGENGRFRLRGGAGGASASGGAIGLWFPSVFLIIPVGLIFLFVVGYASMATLSIGMMSILIFGVRAIMGLSPWEYVAYGALVEVLLVWALRPNIKRLFKGTERVVGIRARRRKAKLQNLSDSTQSSS